jgi:YD repeat-containing protein
MDWLTWDDEGHLATLTENGRTTSYRYDADGNRILATDADGTHTLTLPGDNELKVKGDRTTEGIRYYNHGGDTVAVRTAQGFSYLISDHAVEECSSLGRGKSSCPDSEPIWRLLRTRSVSAGAPQYLARTAWSEVKGMAAGALWGRGVGGGLVKGAN